jgi:hypothetical protein
MHHFNNWDGIQRTHLEEATQSTIGNMEIMRDLGKVINELKKYKKV